MIFPAILSGLGFKNPNIREISSEYLKLEGKNFSAAKNWAVWGKDILDNYNADLIRYYLILNGPETKDTDFSWKSFITANNNDLVGLFGNLVNRIVVFAKKNFDNSIPKGTLDKNFKDDLFKVYCEIGDNIEEGNFKYALDKVMSLVKTANKYFDTAAPWISVKQNKAKCAKDIYICIQYIANISNLIEPFMPYSAEKIRKILNIENSIWMPIELKEGKINDVEILFDRIDRKNIDEEIENLKEKCY